MTESPKNHADEQWRTEGRFWLGDDPDQNLQGTLVLRGNGRSELTVFGIFPEHPSQLFASEVRRVPQIKGVTENHGHIVMLEAIETNRRVRSSGLNRCFYSSRRMFASDSPHDLAMQYVLALSVRVEGLEQWLGVSGFQIEHDHKMHRVTITHQLPELPIFSMDDDTSARFSFVTNGLTYTNPQVEASLKQSASLTILSTRPRPLDELLEAAQTVADLICLGIGEAMAFSPLEAKFAIPTTEPNGMWASTFCAMNSSPDTEVPHPVSMLFEFRGVQSRFGEMLRSWYTNISTVRSTYQLYFATIRSPGMYTEHRLFNFFQALESVSSP